MRVWALAVALVAAAGVAHADEDSEDVDGEFVPVPKRSIALSFGGHGTRIGGISEAGVGPSLELALGGGRWQYFAEGAVHSSVLTTSDTVVGGRMVHAGFGARWIARQFRPDAGGGIELFLLGRGGLQRFYLDDGTRLGRPELAVGFGIQGRLYKRPRIAFRLDLRVLLAPNDRDDVLVACSARCMTDDSSSNGFSTGVGFAW
jgi:hypothetical protein